MITCFSTNNSKQAYLVQKTYPGTDVSSDHNPVVARIRITLKTIKKKPINKKTDMQKLKNNSTLEMNIKMKLNYNLKAIKVAQTESNSSEDLWQPIKDVILNLGKEELDYAKKKMKQKSMIQ